MKKYFALLTGLAVVTSTYSQGRVIEEMDALKYSQTQIIGTALSMGMAGAMSSLGGDMSAVSQNPAGIAVYRSSELAATLNLSFINTQTNQMGNKQNENLTKFSLDNVGYVGTVFTRSSGSGIMNWNFGFNYNRLKSFDRNYTSRGPIQDGTSSLTDYIAYITSVNNPRINSERMHEDNNPYDNRDIPWLSTLAYQGYLINPWNSDSTEYKSHFNNFIPMNGTSLNVSERGHVDTYDFTLGFNYANLLYVGANLGITDLQYTMNSYYTEDFANNEGYQLANYLDVSGTGINFKIGAILRPAYFWRIGLAYHSPTYYSLSETYIGDVSSNFAESTGTPGYYQDEYLPITDYSLNTPQKLVAGTSFVIGAKGVLSFDYEYCDYSRIKVEDNGGFNVTPPYLKEDLIGTHTIRVGGEYRINPSFAVRAGYARVTSPLSADVRNENVEIITGGTIPNYTVDKGYNYYTCGLGYRYKSVFVDLAYAMRSLKEDVYAFSPAVFPDSSDYLMPTVSSMRTNRSNVLLTFGVTFGKK
ncbi:MAG: outer membrane protein transport protein [Candidatus Azobacteroides sp.]|nr:outer membrane protein transport protein [Candidatus Azobacteroides sp.]